MNPLFTIVIATLAAFVIGSLVGIATESVVMNVIASFSSGALIAYILGSL